MIGLLLVSELFIHVDVYSIIRRHIIATQCLPGLVAQLPQKGVGVVGLTVSYTHLTLPTKA